MAERFTNGARTALQTSVNNALGTIEVDDGTGFPGAGRFRIRVDTELMLVTAVSGTTWAVDRGAESTTPASHAAGADVVQVLTAGALQELTGLTTDQSANTVFAGPASGGGGPAEFRGLVAADLPTSGIVTSVDGSGGSTGMTFSGGPVTGSGTLTLGGTLAVGSGGTGSGTSGGARTNLGLAIGSDVQAWDANLDVLAGITIAVNTFPARASTGSAAAKTITEPASEDDTGSSGLPNPLSLLRDTVGTAVSGLNLTRHVLAAELSNIIGSLTTRSIAAPFQAALVDAIGSLFGTGAGARSSNSYARIVNERHFDRLSALLQDAVAQGATLVVDGRVLLAHEPFLQRQAMNG